MFVPISTFTMQLPLKFHF